MPILYMLCGPSGAGKSTWARKFIEDHFENDIRYVSRDEIRFSMIKEDEDYFSHETEVFRKFVGTIGETLIDGFDVIADATHLNRFSRRKVTQALDMRKIDYQIIYVSFNASAEVCIAHNTNRTGRANVSDSVIRNMCRDFRAPTYDEDDRVINIIEVNNE